LGLPPSSTVREYIRKPGGSKRNGRESKIAKRKPKTTRKGTKKKKI